MGPPALVVTAIALTGLTAACGSAATPADGGETEPSALSFESVTTDGEAFDASNLDGEDVVLWFWAPWCTICRTEAPSVVAAAASNEDVRVIGVASSGSVEEMRAFVAETETSSLTHVADVPGDVWRQFEVVAQPTFVFIDDDGRTQTFAGALSEEALIDAMAQLAAA